LSRKNLYPLFNDNYSVFDRPGADACDQLSTAASTFILGNGQTPATYLGDGIVDAQSQQYNDIVGFPSGAAYQPCPYYIFILHTEEPGQEAHISDALGSLIGW